MESPEIGFFDCSKRGLRKRNDDTVRVRSFYRGHKRITLAAVADGMGGYEGGNIASKLAIKDLFSKIKKYFNNSTDFPPPREVINNIFQEINKKLYQQSQKNHRLSDMGTTLTSIVIVDNEYQIAHIGDSRAYRISREEIFQITEDHSVFAEALKEGKYTRQELAKMPFKNALTRNLGNKDEVIVDILPKDGFYKIQGDEILVLLTDGVFSAVSELELFESIVSNEKIKNAGRNILNLALKKGSRDNLSIVIIEAGRVLRRRYMASKMNSRQDAFRKALFRWICLGGICTVVLFILLFFLILRK